MAGKNYFTTGITELLILFLLSKRDYYVYEITKTISNSSEGLLNISQNTIYTATYKLENEKKISEYSKLVGRKRTRVYYHIEPDGRRYLEELITNYQTITAGVEKIFALSEEYLIYEKEENE